MEFVGISHQEQRTQTQDPTLTLLKAMSYLQGQENRIKPQQQRPQLSQSSQVSTWFTTVKNYHNHTSPHLVRNPFLTKASNQLCPACMLQFWTCKAHAQKWTSNYSLLNLGHPQTVVWPCVSSSTTHHTDATRAPCSGLALPNAPQNPTGWDCQHRHNIEGDGQSAAEPPNFQPRSFTRGIPVPYAAYAWEWACSTGERFMQWPPEQKGTSHARERPQGLRGPQ